MPFKDNFLNPDGSFWSPKVSDLYVPEKLGYSYGFNAPTAVASNIARTMTLERSLNTILGAPTAANINTDKVATAVVENTESATPEAALALKINVPKAALQGVVRSVPVGSGFETMDFSAASEASARGSHALAILRNVAITDPSTTTIHIYLGDEPVPADASTSDPRYVGSFAVLDHGGGGHGAHGDHDLPSFVLDLTDALQRVYGSAGTIPSAIGLQLLVGNETGNGKAGSATPQRVEVVIVSG
jgi:tyrosinase